MICSGKTICSTYGVVPQKTVNIPTNRSASVTQSATFNAVVVVVDLTTLGGRRLFNAPIWVALWLPVNGKVASNDPVRNCDGANAEAVCTVIKTRDAKRNDLRSIMILSSSLLLLLLLIDRKFWYFTHCTVQNYISDDVLCHQRKSFCKDFLHEGCPDATSSVVDAVYQPGHFASRFRLSTTIDWRFINFVSISILCQF